MKIVIISVLFMILFVSCSENEPDIRSEQLEFLVSHNWVSEKFIYEDLEYDSIIVYADVIETIDYSFPIVYAGDQLRAASWMKLGFISDQYYLSDLMNISFVKCKSCDAFDKLYYNEFPSQGKFQLKKNYIEIEENIDGEWQKSESYMIDFLENDRIKIYNWFRYPVNDDNLKLVIAKINDIDVEEGEYYFDVIFKAEE